MTFCSLLCSLVRCSTKKKAKNRIRENLSNSFYTVTDYVCHFRMCSPFMRYRNQKKWPPLRNRAEIILKKLHSVVFFLNYQVVQLQEIRHFAGRFSSFFKSSYCWYLAFGCQNFQAGNSSVNMEIYRTLA